jgi:hypothetical protein
MLLLYMMYTTIGGKVQQNRTSWKSTNYFFRHPVQGLWGRANRGGREDALDHEIRQPRDRHAPRRRRIFSE